ncbi:hypothetical protein LPJ56_000342 [Coemansia sp. RSA 2599]|nr:hypothetical protein LPJ56_000342 [Coemansia sp. RSA 2599]
MKTPHESFSRPQSPPQPQKSAHHQANFFRPNTVFSAEPETTTSLAVSRPQLDDLLLSPAKARVLKKTRRHRLVWISVELLVCVVLLALLVLHSFRLNKNKGDNTYAQWSSSWVMVLLSVLLVIFGFAVFITFYYYRTVLIWIKDPATSDEEVEDPQKRHAHGVGWRFLRPRGQRSGSQQEPRQQLRQSSILPTYAGYRRNFALQHQRQYQQGQHLEDPSSRRPWLATRGRNSRAWRQMRYREQQQQQQQQRQRGHRRESSMSSGIDSGDILASPKSLHSESPRKSRHSSSRRQPANDAPSLA